jgi:hypothetical protein
MTDELDGIPLEPFALYMTAYRSIEDLRDAMRSGQLSANSGMGHTHSGRSSRPRCSAVRARRLARVLAQAGSGRAGKRKHTLNWAARSQLHGVVVGGELLESQRPMADRPPLEEPLLSSASSR